MEYARRRALLQDEVGYDFRAQVGVSVLLTMNLRDQLNNMKQFNDRARLDTFEVDLGISLRPRTGPDGDEALPGVPCLWKEAPDPRSAPQLDLENSEIGCSLVHLNWRRGNGKPPRPAYGRPADNIPGGKECLRTVCLVCSCQKSST